MQGLSRREQIQQLTSSPLDVLVIGGGVNGAGVLRDLALRNRSRNGGLRLGLVEQRHFASGTSGKNSQLIHGGLRYLKQLEFRLVREALHERGVLLRIAPHLVEPQPFLIPMYGHFARLFYGSGLAMYDLLAGSERIAWQRGLSREEALQVEPGLNPEGLTGAAIFMDCRVHSARLVLENLLEAGSNGAAFANYLRASEGKREADGLWRVPLTDTISGEAYEVRARKLIDARGPWAGASLRLVRGSHLIVPRLNRSVNAISYFEPSGRIIFFIPWGEHWTLVGTTDADHEGSPDDVSISQQEVDYLLEMVKLVFPGAGTVEPLTSYSSLRPLVRDESSSATKTSREHRIWNDAEGILRIAGGKYTTYRSMSEEASDLALRELAPDLVQTHLTAETVLPNSLPNKPSESEMVRHAVQREMVQRLPDLLFVSTYWGYEQEWDEPRLEGIARQMGNLLEWSEERIQTEIALALRLLHRHEVKLA